MFLITLTSTAATVVGLELLARAWIQDLGDISREPPSPAMFTLAFEPYLMFGRQYGWLDDAERATMRAVEGPEAHGYARAGGTFVYRFDADGRPAADRAGFLFRGQPLADDPASDALRIFVVGASVARGVGASSPSRMWHALLQRRLSDAVGRDVRFVSAAVDAYVSAQERLVFELSVLPRCPDAVVFFDGWNDAALPAILGVRPGDPITQGQLYQRFYAPSDGLVQTLTSWSGLFRYLSYRRALRVLDANRRRLASSEGGLARYADATASVYVTNLEAMLGACRRRGLACAAFLQPARALIEEQPNADGPWAVQESLERAAYDAIRSRLSGMRARAAVHDLSEAFARGEPWFVDPVHFGDRGQHVVAEAMFRPLLDLVRGHPRPRGVSRCDG